MSVNWILTDNAVGGTFLSWSLYYLSGVETYLSCKSRKYEILTNDPILSLNAHGFKGNQTFKLNTLDNDFQFLNNHSGDHFLYFHNLKNDAEDKQAINFVKNSGHKSIVVSNRNPLYYCSLTSRGSGFKFSNPTEKYTGPTERFYDFFKTYYNYDLKGDDPIWDQREFIALNYDIQTLTPPSIVTSADSVNLEYYYLDSLDLWTYLDVSIIMITDYFNLNINKDRLPSWNSVYYKWKNIHYKQIIFMQYFDKIIENILNNIDMDLYRFDLDIVQEATIQRVLLYKYNLSLKTFGVEKFLNTKQLYNLLEPNIYHKLENAN